MSDYPISITPDGPISGYAPHAWLLPNLSRINTEGI
jgi:hypothetical protein